MKLFDLYFNNSPFIPFDNSWKTITGELTPLAMNPKLEIPRNRIYSGVDPNSRKFLIKGTNAGNIVITEAYEPNKGPRLFKYYQPPFFNLRVNKKPNFPLNPDSFLNEFQMKYFLELE